jgi:hypothetical protein
VVKIFEPVVSDYADPDGCSFKRWKASSSDTLGSKALMQVLATTYGGTTDNQQARHFVILRDILRVNVGCIHLRCTLILKRRTPEIVADILYNRIITKRLKIPPMSLSKITDRIVPMSEHYAMKTRRGRLPQGGERLISVQ